MGARFRKWVQAARAFWKTQSSTKPWLVRVVLATTLALAAAWFLKYVELTKQFDQCLKMTADLKELQYSNATLRAMLQQSQQQTINPSERLQFEARERGLVKPWEQVYQITSVPSRAP